MKALITGASSGIGRDFARALDKMGYDLILAARREDRMKELAADLTHGAKIIPVDLSIRENCFKLYELTKDEDIDLLINNAGFGIFGAFSEIDLGRELEMIDVNVCAVDILMKLFLKDFIKKDSGRILNVASVAAFMPGPLLSSYYASKAYVLRLTEAVSYELKKRGSRVRLSALCPGPVDTEFNDTAGVKFAVKGQNSAAVAEYALKKMFEDKVTIVPGAAFKVGSFLTRLMPKGVLLSIGYSFQRRKGER
ncbi:MAG: SDR family oxidoreductase [Clostridia bacterium]|nr:SDR family oxidoreductase [Clostridia bacterium]